MSEVERYPWTFDQFQRYSVLKAFLEIFFPGRDAEVLDVGGLSPDREGRSYWLPLKHIFSGNSCVIDLAYAEIDDFVQADGIHLPFKDGSFAVAAALDVVEHVSGDFREDFIAELCRVARSSVVLSAPFRDDDIFKVEELLLEQLKKAYGVEHTQLMEHKRHKLPEIDTISSFLEKHAASHVDFSYGSLKNWLFLQTMKYYFMFRRSSGEIHYFFDKWMAQCNLSSEFEPPHSRHFWICSKEIGQNKLDLGCEDIKKRLAKKPDLDFNLNDLAAFNRKIVDFYSQESVSALVVVSGRGKHLEECLNYLLTQKVEFELEVVVWDISRKKEIEKMVRSRFADLKYIGLDSAGNTMNDLLNVVMSLKGNHVLILSEDIILPADSVSKLHKQYENTKDCRVMSPRIVWKRYFSPVWKGGAFSPKKLLAGRTFSPFGRTKGEKSRWIFSECLFFRKDAVYERKFKGNALRQRNIFMWESTGSKHGIHYEPDLVVHRRA